MKKGILRFVAIFVALTILVLACGCEGTDEVSAPQASGEFEIAVLQTGQSDAIVLNTQKSCVVIDCGEEDDGDEVLQYLNHNNISRIDCLIITHFDKDHVGGAAEVLGGIEVDKIFVPNYAGSNKEYDQYLKALDDKRLYQTIITNKKSLVLDDVLFEIFPPHKNTYIEGDNDFSLAVLASHGNLKFLFAGDAESERILELTQQLEGNYYFLKVPHHGRFDKNTCKFIKFVKPCVSVITDSRKNPADNDTISALKAAGSQVYCTKDGTVFVTSDGTQATVVQ